VPASADVLGEKQQFFVNTTYDQFARTSLTVTLHTISQYAYFYVDDRYWNVISSAERNLLSAKIKTLADEFDTRIYPSAIKLWGEKRATGVNGDPRVTVLLESLGVGFGGYYEAMNEFPKSQAPHSNERQMMAVNIEALGADAGATFLAHEIQHIISFNQKETLRNASEEIWLNELRSEYTVGHLGYDEPFDRSSLNRRTQVFLKTPSDSLTEWLNPSTDYAQISLFADYLAGRYGPEILSESLRSTQTGIESLNSAFQRRGYADRFADAFADWMVASYLNLPASPAGGSSDIRYGYTAPLAGYVRIEPQHTAVLSHDVEQLFSTTLKNWQPIWYELNLAALEGGAARLILNGEPNQRFIIFYIVRYRDGSFAVNRADLANGSRTLYIAENGKPIDRVALVVTNTQKQSGFTGNEPAFQFSVRASIVDKKIYQEALLSADSTTVFNGHEQVVRDGTLIKRQGEKEVYVIQGLYKRYLRPEIIALYGHLASQTPVEVTDDIFYSYAVANYVRGSSGARVYAVWPDGTKHWLNMTGEYFTRSGRDWGAVFVVNDAEVTVYKTGVDITR